MPSSFPPAPPPAAEIVVTGRGLERPLGSVAYDTVVIDRAQLQRSASDRLEDVLRDAAGFAQFRRADARSAHPTSQGATLRGLGGNASSRALLLLDGVPQTDPFGGWLSFPAYPPSRLGLVRITRGGGAGAAGPGALAGTIELESAGPDDRAPLTAALAYGSRDSIDASAGVSQRLGGGAGSIDASYMRGDGFVPVVASQRGPVDRRAPYEQWSVAARGVVPIDGQTELQASLTGFGDRRQRGTAFTANHNLAIDGSLRLVGRGSWAWESAIWLQERDFSSSFASVDATRSTVVQSLDQDNVPATGTGARVELRPPIGHGIELRLGADMRSTRGRTEERYFFVAGDPTRRRVAGGHSLTVGGFAEASATPLPGVTLTAGGRIDRWTLTDGFLRQTDRATGATLPGTMDDPDRHGTRPTGRAGIAWKPFGAVTLRSAAYLGWRLPTLNELYRPFRVGNDTTTANPALDPERLRGVDVGVDYRPLTTLHAGVTLFWNRLDDAIANVTLDATPIGVTRQRQNVDAVTSRGVELDGDARIGDLRLSASYAYTDAHVRASGAAAALDGLRPAQTARHQASATIAWSRPSGAEAAVTLRYVSRQFDDDLETRSLQGATTLDARVAVPVAARLSVELRGENLTDTLVEAGYLNGGIVERATPRTLWIGLRYGG